MRAVKRKNTKPEMVVRRMVHRLGRRFRLNRKDLPGAQELTFVRDRHVIFVHGCFWHGHDCKRGARTPKTNRAYWEAKIARNVAGNAAALEALTAENWQALIIWECEIKDWEALGCRLTGFLNLPWMIDIPGVIEKPNLMA